MCTAIKAIGIFAAFLLFVPCSSAQYLDAPVKKSTTFVVFSDQTVDEVFKKIGGVLLDQGYEIEKTDSNLKTYRTAWALTEGLFGWEYYVSVRVKENDSGGSIVFVKGAIDKFGKREMPGYTIQRRTKPVKYWDKLKVIALKVNSQIKYL